MGEKKTEDNETGRGKRERGGGMRRRESGREGREMRIDQSEVRPANGWRGGQT